jgi:ubiquinone/menaquinone biosynthesis C-methylase UbiE
MNKEGDRRYRRFVKGLLESGGDSHRAVRDAIGGEFEATGLMERDLLISQGLQRDGSVVDVGCGSGRLAGPLSGYLKGSYLGTDVVPELLDYARSTVGRPDWRFELVQGMTIPASDASADIVCFFSVFTHLRHESTYRYLEEAKRVTGPKGKIIFSFLEFAIYSHWDVFRQNVADIDSERPLDQFMSRDAINAWAHHLELRVDEIFDGDVANIPLTQPVVMENGQHFEGMGALGQSVAVLSKN